MTIDEIKETIAINNGYKSGIMGTAWNYAMILTHRRKSQIKLYDELVKELADWAELKD